jgi:hypothetical protein
MAPFFWDSDRGKTRAVTVGGSCGMSEAHAAGLGGCRPSEHCGGTADRLWPASFGPPRWPAAGGRPATGELRPRHPGGAGAGAVRKLSHASMVEPFRADPWRG